jgi:GntR family transcriptional regulator/MocR family aminotransferase
MARSRTSSATELLVQLDRDSADPLHRQLERELRDVVCSGRLAGGTALPSTRALAAQLGLSRGVIVEAYEQLVAEGYLTSLPGGATRVSDRIAARPPLATSRSEATRYRIDFGYGRPDVRQFPRQSWLRSLRRVLNEAPSDRLSYLDMRGAPELRETLTSYLNRVRGTVADPERIVICNGFAQALGLVSQLLQARGGRTIAVEDPGQTDPARVARIHGLSVVPVPIDGEGIVVEALARTSADMVVVTPAHQFPTGAVLSPGRRAELVAWAADGDRLILEDDYDAEYRYDREPIGALHGLAPDHVIYAGSASKTLAPGLRLGWLAVPDGLVDELAAIKEGTDRGSASLEQLAFADFLDRGEFDHHLRRMRPVYRARRDVLLAALRRHFPELRPAGASAGLHVITWLPDGVEEEPLIAHAARAGVGIGGLRSYHSAQGTARPGLLFGYGTVTEDEIEEGIRVVAEALEAVRRAPLATAG